MNEPEIRARVRKIISDARAQKWANGRPWQCIRAWYQDGVVHGLEYGGWDESRETYSGEFGKALTVDITNAVAEVDDDGSMLDATVDMATSKILSQPDGAGSRDYLTVIELLDSLHEGELPRDGQDWCYRHVLSMDGRRPFAWLARHEDFFTGSSVNVCAVGPEAGDNIASLPAAWWFSEAARSWPDDGSITLRYIHVKGEEDARREFAALAARAEEMIKRGKPGGYGVSSVVTVRAQATPFVEAAMREVLAMEQDGRGIKECLLVSWVGDEVRRIEYCRDASASTAPRAGDEVVLQTLDLTDMQQEIREDSIDSAIDAVLNEVVHYYVHCLF